MGHLGPSWAHLGAILGPCLSHLGPSWAHLGAIVGLPGAVLGHLEAILGHCEAILGHVFARCYPFWWLFCVCWLCCFFKTTSNNRTPSHIHLRNPGPAITKPYKSRYSLALRQTIHIYVYPGPDITKPCKFTYTLALAITKPYRFTCSLALASPNHINLRTSLASPNHMSLHISWP